MYEPNRESTLTGEGHYTSLLSKTCIFIYFYNFFLFFKQKPDKVKRKFQENLLKLNHFMQCTRMNTEPVVFTLPQSTQNDGTAVM